MRVPWTARRSNQSILKEISPEYSLEGLMLKLKLQWEAEAPDGKNRLIGKDPGKIESRRERGKQRMRWLGSINGHEFEQTLGCIGRERIRVCCNPWCQKELDRT